MTDHLAVLEEMLDRKRRIYFASPEGSVISLHELNALDAAIALMRGQSWQDIATAPNDRIHVRGLWVRMRRDGRPDEMEWRQYVGYIEDETGRFVDPEYSEDFGWQSDDYDCWMELPSPPKQEDSADEQ